MYNNLNFTIMTITTNSNKEIKILDSMFFVTMTDKFLSGWGKAENKKHKQIVICNNFREAQIILNGIQNLKDCDGMRYLNICSNLPRYNKGRYSVTYRLFSDCSLWIGKSNIK